VKPVLLDTGVIVALLDRSERNHRACVEAVGEIDAPLVTCEAVIAEACFLLRAIPGAADAVLVNVERGEFQIPFALARASKTIRGLMRRYANVPMAFADACLVHLADEIDSGRILTLDDDFAIYRWRRSHVFERLPARTG
jgi:predicted nucleic acid-binding protein